MGAYLKRITSTCKKWELVLWWCMRAVLIYGLIVSFVDTEQYESKIRVMMVVNLAATFIWEITQLLPEKRLLRHLPTYAQDVSSVFIVLTSFGGAFINFYYSLWWWDSSLHFVGGGLSVIAGYVLISCYQKRDKVTVPVNVALLCAFGMSFIIGTAWEIWEFSFDQLTGGDTQHWSLELAREAAAEYGGELRPIFQPAPEMGSVWEARFAIIDTMSDIVLNTIGAVITYIILRIFPYYHKGKNNLNELYAVKELKYTEVETVNS